MIAQWRAEVGGDCFRDLERCKLDVEEWETHRPAVELHRDLIALRRGDPTIARQGADGLDGAVLGPEAFVLRFFGAQPDGDRLVVVNLGRDLRLVPAPEPLLAPALYGGRWVCLWSSEAVGYGGRGPVDLETEDGWFLPGHAAALLAPDPGVVA